MDIISHYSTYTPARTAGAGGEAANQQNVKCMSSDEFMELVRSQGVKAPDQSKFLYNGSETRAQLSDTEIAVLANKYDVHDMDQETYDAFLDELQSMGAISEIEKRQMGYHGIQMSAYMGEDGNWVWCGSPSGVWSFSNGAIENDECIFTPWGEETDICKWLEDRTRKELVGIFEPSTWEQGRAYESLLKGVLKIVNRMEIQQEKNAEAACVPGGDFMERVTSQGMKAPDRSKFLYNGSETRARLSDTEIAALANKYDVRDMSDQEYEAFLDDLESMGAISKYEKRRLDRHSDGAGEDFALDDPRFLAPRVWEAPAGADGRGPAFYQWETDGDVFQWINGRIQWQPGNPDGDPELQKELEEQVEVHRVLAGYVNRMDARREEDAEAVDKAALREQIMDPASEFYTNMFAQMKANVERTRDDKEQQAIVDALGAVLDALSGKEDVSGDKASLNKAAGELTQKIGERIARLKRENLDDPEIVKLESMLQRLQELGIYFDVGDMDGVFDSDEEDSFETLTQLLTRRQAEEAISSVSQ